MTTKTNRKGTAPTISATSPLASLPTPSAQPTMNRPMLSETEQMLINMFLVMLQMADELKVDFSVMLSEDEQSVILSHPALVGAVAHSLRH